MTPSTRSACTAAHGRSFTTTAMVAPPSQRLIDRCTPPRRGGPPDPGPAEPWGTGGPAQTLHGGGKRRGGNGKAGGRGRVGQVRVSAGGARTFTKKRQEEQQ